MADVNESFTRKYRAYNYKPLYMYLRHEICKTRHLENLVIYLQLFNPNYF